MSTLLYNRPQPTIVPDDGITVTGDLAAYTAGADYESRLSINNSEGLCIVQVIESTLPAGANVYVDQDNKQVVVAWPGSATDEEGTVQAADLPQDGKFIAGLDGWNADQGWTYDAGATLHASFAGEQGVRLIKSGTYPCDPGQTITATLNVQQGASASYHVSAEVALYFLDSGFKLIQQAEGNDVVNSSPLIQQSRVTGTAPEGTVYVQFVIGGNRYSEDKPLWVGNAAWDHEYTIHAGAHCLTIQVKDSTGSTAGWSGCTAEVTPWNPPEGVEDNDEWWMAETASKPGIFIFRAGESGGVVGFDNSAQLGYAQDYPAGIPQWPDANDLTIKQSESDTPTPASQTVIMTLSDSDNNSLYTDRKLKLISAEQEIIEYSVSDQEIVDGSPDVPVPAGDYAVLVSGSDGTYAAYTPGTLPAANSDWSGNAGVCRMTFVDASASGFPGASGAAYILPSTAYLGTVDGLPADAASGTWAFIYTPESQAANYTYEFSLSNGAALNPYTDSAISYNATLYEQDDSGESQIIAYGTLGNSTWTSAGDYHMEAGKYYWISAQGSDIQPTAPSVIGITEDTRSWDAGDKFGSWDLQLPAGVQAGDSICVFEWGSGTAANTAPLNVVTGWGFASRFDSYIYEGDGGDRSSGSAWVPTSVLTADQASAGVIHLSLTDAITIVYDSTFTHVVVATRGGSWPDNVTHTSYPATSANSPTTDGTLPLDQYDPSGRSSYFDMVAIMSHNPEAPDVTFTNLDDRYGTRTSLFSSSNGVIHLFGGPSGTGYQSVGSPAGTVTNVTGPYIAGRMTFAQGTEG